MKSLVAMFDIDPSILDSERKVLDEDDMDVVGGFRENERRDDHSIPLFRDDEFLSLRRLRLLSWDSVYHDTPRTFKFIRNGKVEEEWTQNHPHHSVCTCQFSKEIRERELKIMSSDDVHLSGSLQNMSHEDFQKFFNMDIEKRIEFKDQIEGTLRELLKYLFCEDKTPVSELKRMASSGNPEDRENAYKILGERIHINETAKNILSVWIHKDKSIQYDINEEAKDEERKRLREHDKKYKPKPQVKTEDKKVKITQSKNEKMRATLLSLAPPELKTPDKIKELNDWIDKQIVEGRNK